MSERETQRLFLDQKVNYILKPMLLEILKKKPEKMVDFMIFWLETNGRKYEENQQTIFPEKQETQKNIKENISFDQEEQNIQNIEQKLQINNQQQQSMENNSQEQEHSIQTITESDEEEIEQNDDQFLKKIEKGQNKKKNGISAEAYGQYNQQGDFQARKIEKTKEQNEMIIKILNKNFMFNSLGEEEQKIVVEAMEIKNYEKRDFVIKQGDDGQELYIVSEGILDCTKLFPGNEQDTFLKKYYSGEVFGELSLLYNTPRAASIQACEKSVLFCLDRDTFNHIVKNSTIKKREKFDKFLGQIELLNDLDPYERSKLSDVLITETFKKDQDIIKEGEKGDRFYLIINGEAVALKNINNEEKIVFQYKENDDNNYFGELALVDDGLRKATIRVTSEKMEVASLDKKSFQSLLGSIEQILMRNKQRYEKFMNKNQLQKYIQKNQKRNF